MVKIFIERENKNIELSIISEFKKKEIQIFKILEKLNISKNSIIIIKNDEITLEEEFVNDNEELKFLSVVSGG
jgi:sulfur carrier protein ThiS